MNFKFKGLKGESVTLARWRYDQATTVKVDTIRTEFN